jgi:RNA recognition motif-containing protein
MGTRLYVGNLSYSTTEQELQDLFGQAGGVADVSLPTDRATGRMRGFGFIEMASEDAAQEAIRRFNGFMLRDRELTVNEARPREERSGGGYGGGSRSSSYGGGGSYGNQSYGSRGHSSGYGGSNSSSGSSRRSSGRDYSGY